MVCTQTGSVIAKSTCTCAFFVNSEWKSIRGRPGWIIYHRQGHWRCFHKILRWNWGIYVCMCICPCIEFSHVYHVCGNKTQDLINARNFAFWYVLFVMYMYLNQLCVICSEFTTYTYILTAIVINLQYSHLLHVFVDSAKVQPPASSLWLATHCRYWVMASGCAGSN